MKAAWYTHTGPAREVLQVGTMADPEPAPGAVLVRVQASGVNPSDVKLRAGARPGGMPYPKIVPHSDGAGVIEAVGQGVDPARVGERVWLWNSQWERPWGTAAELIALPAIQAVPLPDDTSMEAGACLGIPAMTAWHAVFADGPVTGQTVLVAGGAGTVARYAIQLARGGGARVITTVSGPEKASYALAAGAHHVINYHESDVAEVGLELTGGQGVDRIIELEFGANLAANGRLIRRRGTIAAYGSARQMRPELPFAELMFKAVTVRFILVYILSPEQHAAAIDGLSRELEQGRLTHSVAGVYPLESIAVAHERVESARKMGSVVVAP